MGEKKMKIEKKIIEMQEIDEKIKNLLAEKNKIVYELTEFLENQKNGEKEK